MPNIGYETQSVKKIQSIEIVLDCYMHLYSILHSSYIRKRVY